VRLSARRTGLVLRCCHSVLSRAPFSLFFGALQSPLARSSYEPHAALGPGVRTLKARGGKLSCVRWRPLPRWARTTFRPSTSGSSRTICEPSSGSALLRSSVPLQPRPRLLGAVPRVPGALRTHGPCALCRAMLSADLLVLTGTAPGIPTSSTSPFLKSCISRRSCNGFARLR